MTGNKYLLDTNIISAWLEKDTTIAQKIEEAAQVFIPVIVLGELHYGARFSTKIDYNLYNISRVISNYVVLLIDEASCNHYGIIKATLRRKGKPIPENDIWIAAIAVQHDLIVATRDAHFNEVDDLTTELW